MKTEAQVEWRSVPGFPGYEASSDGRVLSLPKRRRTWPKILKADRNHQGYLRVTLWRDGQRVRRSVHQIVCWTFHGPPPVDMEVRHLNGVNDDNRAENLAWGTGSENALDKVRHGTHPEANKTHCPRDHPYDEENTQHTSQGRKCRACARERMRRYYQRKRLSA